MKNFNVGALRQWKQVATGEVLDFPTPQNGYRKVTFEVIAGETVAVQAVSEKAAYLVALGDGHMNVTFSTDAPVGIVFLGDPEALVFIKTMDATQVIPESHDASYTTIEPRPAGPSDEVKRMMQIMHLNNERRIAQQMEALREEARRARRADPVVEDDPEAPVAPQHPAELNGGEDA